MMERTNSFSSEERYRPLDLSINSESSVSSSFTFDEDLVRTLLGDSCAALAHLNDEISLESSISISPT